MTLSRGRRPRGAWGPVIIVIAAAIAVAPLFLRGPSCDGDLVFHYISWIDAEHSMSTGLLYPHWANSPNFGAGQPQFVFYPPLSWMAGAALGAVLPWNLVPLALFILLLTGTGLANRALAREALSDGAATLAGCAAIFFGYVLFNLYKRNDFAELTGGFWIPLLLLFSLRRRNPSGRFWERTFDGSTVPLALIVAGTWLSNVPLAIMACYLLAAVALVSALIERSWVSILRAVVSLCAGMGLASIYLIPAISERSWVNIRNAVDQSDYVVENNWLFGRHANPDLAYHDLFLHRVSNIAVVMLVIALLGAGIVWKWRTVRGTRSWWIPIALIPPAVFLLLLPVSEPLWNVMPELRLLQFPWRWLVVLEAPMAIFFASAFWFDRKAVRIPFVTACAAVFVGISLAAFHWWAVECESFITSIQKLAPNGIIIPGKPEYAPPGIRFPVLNVLLDADGKPLVDPFGKALVDSEGKPLVESYLNPKVQTMPAACLLEEPSRASTQGEINSAPAWDGASASCNSSGWQELSLVAGTSNANATRSRPEQKWFMGFAGHPGYVILRLRYYPAWAVKVNGVPVTTVADRDRGLMSVPVQRGAVVVAIDWKTTGDVVAGRWVSGIALLLLTGLHLIERRRLWNRLIPYSAGHAVSPGRSEPSKAQAEHPVRPIHKGEKDPPRHKPPKKTKRE